MPRSAHDPLKAFITLRRSLEAERARLTARLSEIEAALGSVIAAGSPKATTAISAPRKAKRVENALSLKAAVLQVTAQESLSKAEILSAVKKLGYRFTANDPTNSLNTLLYGKQPKFKNQDGKFSPV